MAKLTLANGKRYKIDKTTKALLVEICYGKTYFPTGTLRAISLLASDVVYNISMDIYHEQAEKFPPANAGESLALLKNCRSEAVEMIAGSMST